MEQEEQEQMFSNMEEIVKHVDRRGAWQYWTMARCCVLVTGISTVVYAQSIFFTGKMNYECVMYEDSNPSLGNYTAIVNSGSSKNENNTECRLLNGHRCIKWRYSSPYYNSTMVNEFNLVCDRAAYAPTFQSALVWAQLIGLPVWGIISDKFGRLSTLRFAYAVFLLTGLAMTFVRSLLWLIVLRAFIGFVLAAGWNACFVIAVELATSERRNSIGIYVGAGWPLGAAIAALLAHYIRNYRHLSAASVVAATICAPIVFFMEESPRWMVMHKRFQQASTLLHRHVKHANEALPEGYEFLQRIYKNRMERDNSDVAQSQFRQMKRLITDRRLRWRTLSLVVVWVGVAFVFNGLLYYGTGSLPFSPMLTLGFTSVCRLFGQPLYVQISNIFGARNGMILALAVSAISTIVMGFVPMHAESLYTSIAFGVLYVTGYLAVDLDLSVIYIVTGELYPTVLRQSSLGFFSMAARLGSMAAPYVATLLAQYWLPLPTFVFGAACVIATIASLALPRADDALLPETVTEAALMEDTSELGSEVTISTNSDSGLMQNDAGRQICRADFETCVDTTHRIVQDPVRICTSAPDIPDNLQESVISKRQSQPGNVA